MPEGTISEPPFAGVTVKVPPLQIEAVLSDILATGLTMTCLVTGGPTQ